MDDRDIRKLLESALERLGYSVAYDRLEDGKGGHYRLKEKKEVVIDPRLTEGEKVDILVETIRGLDTSSLYLPPVVRNIINGKTTPEDW